MLTEEQRLKRNQGIGASDSPIIMGYSTYKTPYQLYLEKIGAVSNESEVTEPQYWGNVLEPIIIQEFGKQNNVEISFPDTVYHPEYPFIFANLDGWVESKRWVVEAKCVNTFQRKEWDMALNDGIPLIYLIQIAKQCAITNAEKGYCAVLIGGMEYKQFVYERDLGLEDLIIQSDLDFWECVQTRKDPSPINTSDCRLKYKKAIQDKVTQANFPAVKVLKELSEIKSKIKELEVGEEYFKMQIMSYMEDAEYLVGQEGEILVTWKATKKGNRIFSIK